jgi:DNA-binding protein HU-beta
MNKSELSEKISERLGGLNKAQVESVIDGFIDITTSELKKGGEVALTGFGTFSARKRKGREGINPRNPQEKITIPAVVVAKFKAGKHLKDALKGDLDRPEAISEPEPAAIDPSPEA